MAELTDVDGRPVVDYMARDARSLLQAMRERVPQRLPEWKDFRAETDFGNVVLELFAHMGDILSYYQDRVANESFLGTARTRGSVIRHLALIGYRLGTAAPASASLQLTVPASCEETITISRGDAFATRRRRDRPSVRFEYAGEQPLTIDCRELPVRDGRKVHEPGIPVEEGRLVRDELLGVSDGSRFQRYTLLNPRLILRASGSARPGSRDIVVTTVLGGAVDPWTLQETLAFSRASQRDYTVQIDEDDRATVAFGDDELGAIPSTGAEIRVTYRVGGGQAGNLPADTIQTIVEAPRLALLGARVTNPDPATGGADRESVEHAVLHAPAVFRSLKRAVTAADYQALALDFNGVGKVRVEAGNWNTVTLFVAPQGGGQVSDVLEANLLAYFEDKRPVSTVIEVEDVHYVAIRVTVEVGVDSYHSREQVTEDVRQAAGALLAFDNVTFGQTLYLSKFYEAVEAVEGVAFALVSEFRRETDTGPPVDPLGKLELLPQELPAAPDDPAYTGGVKVLAEGGY
jgi:uncharacterized phage protein gp47/JayE